MPSSEQLVFEGDSTKVIQAIKQVVDAEEKLKKEIKATSKAAKEGNDEAFEAWQRQKSELRKVGREHARLRGELDKLTNETEEYGEKGEKAGLLIKGVLVGGVAIAIKRIVDLQAEYNKELAESVRRQDEVGRKLRVQALLSDEEYQKQILPRVGRAANRSAVSLEEAQTVATELISQGFSKDEATGSALEELLLGAVATNTDDKQAFATAIAGFIKSQGRELNQENVRDVTIPLAALFQGTAIQGQDLTSLAQIGSLMKEFGVSQQSGFAAFDVLKDIGNNQPEKAATALRNMVSIMSTAKADKNISAVLEEIGGPELADRIDLVGENFPTALANLAEALNTLDESSKKQALSKIFGREVSAPAATLLGNLDKFGGLLELQRSDAATGTFRQLVEKGTSGVGARQTRIANDKAIREFRQGQEAEEREAVAQLIEERMLATGSTPHQAGIMKGAFLKLGATTDILNSGGFIDERNVGELLNKIPGLNQDDRTAILQKLGRYKGGTRVDTSNFFGNGRFSSDDSKRTGDATFSPFFMNEEGKPIFDNSQVPKLGGTEGSGRKIDFTNLGADAALQSLETRLKEAQLEKKKLEFELEEAKKPQAVIDRQTKQFDRMIELLEIQISEAQLKKLRNRNASE
ncbi:phage tail tape measure protein [Thalassoroseus pseudoceratinae]|uniref:phage tail tape measure protein n=1 Tax=Thalassoroseus pseudoceratinae TaxID=2713176 RepID=UPI001420EC56|nr:phage tail tape measure protein [Thalassoroseus pseudoceratinae]